MQYNPTFFTLPVVIAVAVITGLFSIAAVILAQIFIFPKTRAETKSALKEAEKKGFEIGKIEAETEAAELANEEKRNLLSNQQISKLLQTALDQSKQIDELLTQSSLQKVEIDRLVTLVGYNENEKAELNAVIKYQQGEMERIQKSWADTLVKLNESRQRENLLSDKLELSIRQANRFERLLTEAGIVSAPTGALARPLETPKTPLPEANSDNNNPFKTQT